MLKPFLLVILLAFSIAGISQQLSKSQVQRIADACKLWGHVKYFHPHLQYKKISWDSSFSANAPRLLTVNTKAGFEEVLTDLFKVLNDPVTKVIKEYSPQTSYYGKDSSPVFKWMNDVLVVEIHNVKDIGHYRALLNATNKAAPMLDSAEYILMDFRADKKASLSQDLLDISFHYSGMVPLLTTQPLLQPSTRSVAHQGLANKTSWDIYSSHFRVNHGSMTGASARKKKKIAFLINNNSMLPKVAYALQDAGNAIILGEGKTELPFPGTTLQYTVSDSVTISLRTAEPLYSNSEGAARLNQTLNDGQAPEENITKAIGILKNPDWPARTPAKAQPVTGLYFHETYKQDKYPDLGNRLLALSKIYSVIDYFYPNKHLMDRKWNEVLEEFIPKFIHARDSMEYNFIVAEMYTHIQDGHGLIISPVLWEDHFTNKCRARASFATRVIEDQVVVTAIVNDSAAAKENIEVGDVILEVNGKDPMKFIDEMRKYQPASNYVTQTHYLTNLLLLGNEGEHSTLRIKGKNNKIKQSLITHSRAYNRDFPIRRRTQNKGNIFRLINPEIGYVDMQRLDYTMIDSMLNIFRNTKSFIIDMRGYPRETAGYLAPRLTEKNQVTGTSITYVLTLSPHIAGDEDVSEQTTKVIMQRIPSTDKWRYTGKTVMLMNETTQSQAEHSGLFFKAANNTMFIGSQTAGANGNITTFEIPGGITLYMSGMNVGYPNGKTMQRTGLIPDIQVKPTINGIRSGKDEVLDRAIQYLQKGK